LRYQPVVAQTHAGTTSECFDQAEPAPGTRDPELGAWECTAASWYKDADLLDIPWAESGPANWERIDAADLADAPRTRLDPIEVTGVVEDSDRISFRVDQVGVPVVVKASYFPNWEVDGADGPFRLAPNLMVVIPTENEVTLTYGLTPVDWLGRVISLVGLVGLIALARWKGARRYAAFAPSAERREDGRDDRPASPPPGGADPSPPPVPGRSEPAPALR
jgi:hypothetical protein